MQDFEGSDSRNERRPNVRRGEAQESNEISLLELYRVFVKRKITIIVAVLLSLSLGLLYASLATKRYQVSARLLVPVQDDLILSKHMEVKTAPAAVFNDFQTSLLTDKLWNDFVEKNQDIFKNKETSAIEYMENPIGLGSDKKFVGKHILVKYQSTDAPISVSTLQRYIEFVKKNFTQNIVAVHKRQINRDIEDIENNIRLERKYEKIRRADRISVIASNLEIAKSLDISDDRQFLIKGKSKLTVLTGNTSIPVYMRGSKILEAELFSLKNRQSDDAYVPGLRKKQMKLDQLKSITFDSGHFKPFILDGKILGPNKVSPKLRLIYAASIVLGFFLGVFIAFISEFVQKTPIPRSEKSISNP